MTKGKIVKIAFDLDGVIIGKPPFVPKKILEWLVRSHKNKNLSYRYPTLEIERFMRWLSHYHIFRPAIRENLEFVKRLSKKNYELFVISGRYSFLKRRTEKWFKVHNLENSFKEVHLNTKNEQPHVFKEKILKKLKPDIFLEDDELIVNYLKKKFARKGIKIGHVNNSKVLSNFI